jgi:hypothetical protein
MSEPTLSDISDYDTLKGEKKKVVWGVIIVGLLLGAMYVVAMKIYNNTDDAISTTDIITTVPPSKNIPVR